MSALHRVLGSLAAGMILSVAFFAYSWEWNHAFVGPILPGAYLAEALNRIVRLPVWLNQVLFFIFNGIFWGTVILGIWSGIRRLRRRLLSGAT
jgi:hypothetical protein